MAKPTLSICIVTSVIVAVIAVILSAVSYPVVDKYMTQKITEQVLLTNGSQLYETWKDPKVPVYVQVYLFDLQNKEEVINGSKPVVKQRGPFTYREQKVKTNITHHDNGTVSYREVSTYFYDDAMSSESELVNITTVNIFMLTLVSVLDKYHIHLPKIITNAFAKLVKSEGIFITKSAQKIVWGYNDTILSFAEKVNQYLPTELKFNIPTKVGIFASKNNTDDGLYTVYTGEKNISLLGIIDKYNGKNHVDFWTSDEANMINGTDGTLCPPFVVKKDLTVQMFSTDICRSIYGTYRKDVYTLDNIRLYRYSAPKEALEKPALNPANAGFCTPAGNCLGTGVLNISTCQTIFGVGLPLIVSLPHFYMAEPMYQDAVIGINPNQSDLSTDIDIEPHTGLVMHAAKRLQINVYLSNSTNLRGMDKLRTMVYPVMWVNESVSIDKKSADKFKSDLLIPLTAVFVVQIVLFGLGAVLLILSVVLVALWCRKRNVGEDYDSLINNTE